MNESDKQGRILKQLLLLNPRPETCVRIIEFVAKHGAFNGTFKQVKGKQYAITGSDEKSILAGKFLETVESECRLANMAIQNFDEHALGLRYGDCGD